MAKWPSLLPRVHAVLSPADALALCGVDYLVVGPKVLATLKESQTLQVEPPAPHAPCHMHAAMQMASTQGPSHVACCGLRL